MKTITKISTASGGAILVETDLPAGGANVVNVAKIGEVVDKTNVQLETALSKVNDLAASISNVLNQPVHAPEEAEVEFGIKLNAEANAIISATSIEGHFKFVLKWRKSAQPR